MRHQHHRLQSSRLPWSSDGEIVSDEARVDLSVIHGAGVHVGRLLLLLQHLQLLGGEGEGEEAEDDGVEEGDDGESEGPANTTRSQLVIISLGSTHSSHLVIVPASGEAEETNEETEAGEKLESAADSEHVRGP